jgi:hypothetical protein
VQSSYLEQFDREMGCTVAEWLMWLPAAMGDAAWAHNGDAVHASLPAVPGAQLAISWRVGEPRRIALMVMPRLHVHFQFTGMNDAQRYTFMKRFDLYMQRGGG